MNRQEKRTALTLAAVYSVRMLGLFMILPVLPLYTKTLADVTPFLIGIAIGIYGLTQAAFQIPLGLLSDKVGRKPVIATGLALFLLGSVIAALAHDNIYQIIFGRALQGMGAIAAATMALAADLTREEHRAKVMALIGMTIGIAFASAMVIGPVLNQYWGISGIFWSTAVLALIGIMLILFVVPTPARTIAHRDAGIIGGYIKPALSNASLLRLNLSVFLLHLVMTANFTVLPLVLLEELGYAHVDHWKIYLPIFLLSFMLAAPQIILAEKYRKIKPLLLFSIVLLGVAQLLMGYGYDQRNLLLSGFLIFFVGFNFLEAVLPSLVAKFSSVNTKGTAMGVFTSSQFGGIFFGGLLGGYVATHQGTASVLLMGALLAVIWLAFLWTLPTPVFHKSKTIRLRKDLLADPVKTSGMLMQINGIEEAAVAPEEGTAYLKVSRELDELLLQTFQPANIRSWEAVRE